MTQQEINYYKAAACLSLIPDDENPLFVFNGITKDLLMDIINGKIDPIEIARIELESRGYNNTGTWIGWNSKTTADVLV